MGSRPGCPSTESAAESASIRPKRVGTAGLGLGLGLGLGKGLGLEPTRTCGAAQLLDRHVGRERPEVGMADVRMLGLERREQRDRAREALVRLEARLAALLVRARLRATARARARARVRVSLQLSVQSRVRVLLEAHRSVATRQKRQLTLTLALPLALTLAALLEAHGCVGSAAAKHD